MPCINFMGAGAPPVGVQSIRLQLGMTENSRAQTVLGPGHLFFYFAFTKWIASFFDADMPAASVANQVFVPCGGPDPRGSIIAVKEGQCTGKSRI
jgi:hypothetical protein